MGKILSIQSHVAYGYVGNKVASFVIQRMGHEIIQIDNLQFSNHTGYDGGFGGEILSKNHVLSVFNGLNKNNLMDDVNYCITGYLGDKNTAEATYEIIKAMKSKNKDFVYFCDPVMGDDFTHCFVKPEIREILSNKLICLADVVKANHTEAQFLFSRDIDSERGAMDFYDFLLQKTNNPNLKLIITSFMRGKQDHDDKKIDNIMIKNDRIFYVSTELLNLHPLTCGTGDLVMALFASHVMSGRSDEDSLRETILSTFEILKRGVENGATEMQLIKNQDCLRN